MLDEHSPGIIPQDDVARLREGRQVIRQEAAALAKLADSLQTSFCDAVQLILDCQGTVVVTGVGKAGLIGTKISATLSSTGTPSRFLHPTEALHGDMGCIGPLDVVLALSNSGTTEEVLRLIEHLRERVSVIALTRDNSSPLATLATLVVPTGHHAEAGELGLAPTCSTTAMLALGDALSIVLARARGFTAREFARFHPGGHLGRQLRHVRDVMRTGDQLRIALESETVRDVMVRHSKPGRRTGAVLLVNSAGRLAGIFTDSDLARMFEQRRDHLLDTPVSSVMTAQPTTIGPDVLLPEAIHLMSERKLSELPVLNEQRQPLGLLDITDVLECADPEMQQQATDLNNSPSHSQPWRQAS
ncbi:MAG: KpsF/GutQ family sugar-phosphate isomerase [Planctomycetaceae bacterium]|nr:KpsF/GutQ family sugar-phosphate isomerase [Planctomycetaceae bacterium]